jgi:hypothetical protein
MLERSRFSHNDCIRDTDQMTPSPTKRSAPNSHQRGQAMTEYALVIWFMMGLLLFGLTLPISAGGTRTNLIGLLLWAIQQHYDNIYYVINLPFP